VRLVRSEASDLASILFRSDYVGEPEGSHVSLREVLKLSARGFGGRRIRDNKQGVLTENLWPKLFSEAPRCAPLRLVMLEQPACRL